MAISRGSARVSANACGDAVRPGQPAVVLRGPGVGAILDVAADLAPRDREPLAVDHRGRLRRGAERIAHARQDDRLAEVEVVDLDLDLGDPVLGIERDPPGDVARPRPHRLGDVERPLDVEIEVHEAPAILARAVGAEALALVDVDAQAVAMQIDDRELVGHRVGAVVGGGAERAGRYQREVVGDEAVELGVRLVDVAVKPDLDPGGHERGQVLERQAIGAAAMALEPVVPHADPQEVAVVVEPIDVIACLGDRVLVDLRAVPVAVVAVAAVEPQERDVKLGEHVRLPVAGAGSARIDQRERPVRDAPAGHCNSR